jgi:NAD(P)-dependent dehydrogenase (short-subunit alcohol dehydrogenase family)
MHAAKKTWLITGASKGIGLALARQVLAQGGRVAATSRDIHTLHNVLGAASENVLPIQVDLADEHSVKAGIEQIVAAFGEFHVVVNCAGYAHQGTLEALSDIELRHSFDVNVFGPLNVLRHTLPHLRKRRAGHIVNVSSIVGFNGGYAGWGSYAASKFALAGMTEALADEISELGIRATVVYPGPVRTDFLSAGSLQTAERTIDDYRAAQASLDLHLNQLAGKQNGAPHRVAVAIWNAVYAEAPPLHLFLGKIASQLADDKIEKVKRDLRDWETVSLASDFS